MNPILSVFCPAHNHENYIEQAINGFVSQKTDFDFEIIIHDDASSDTTPKIIKKYEVLYPNKIRGIYQAENKLSKDRSWLTKTIFKEAKGKYIALCEGDDYWTDPYKLQKQVDFLEKNSRYVICGHRNLKINQNGEILGESPLYSTSSFSQKDIAKKNPLSTMTVLFRNIIDTLPDWYADSKLNDWALYMLLTNHGDAWIMPDIMAAYRRHDQGIWTGVASKVRYEQMNSQLKIFIKEFPDHETIFKQNSRKNSIGILYWSKFNLRKMLLCLVLLIITPNSEVTIRDWFYKLKNPLKFSQLG